MPIHASAPIPHSRLVDAARPAVLTDVARAESALARFLDRPTVQSLPSNERARVADSIAAVQVLLARYAESVVTAATLEALDVQARQLRVIRPQNHVVQVGLLQDLGGLTSNADAQTAMLHELASIVAGQNETGRDVAQVQQDLASARLALAESVLAIAGARETVLAITAVTSPHTMEDAGTQVDRVTRLLGHAAERIMLVELAFQPVGAA